jgi:excisionase family DNA binding protein
MRYYALEWKRQIEGFIIAKYVKPKTAAGMLGVHVRTLVKWEQEGKIQAIKTPSGQRRYDIESYTGK